jgi:6,7-dimethyl-8-ribityllumazine synthase
LTTIEGKMDGSGLRFLILQARFNDFIGKQLAEGAEGAMAELEMAMLLRAIDVG